MSNARCLLAQLPYAKLRIDLAANNIATNAWTQLTAALEKPCTAVQIYYTGVGILRISKGAIGEETATPMGKPNELPLYIVPGGESVMVPLELPIGARFSARALDQDVLSGELVINFFG